MREIILSSKNLCKSFANNGGQKPCAGFMLTIWRLMEKDLH